MGSLEIFVHWWIQHWKSWGIAGIGVGVGAFINWLLTTRKQLNEAWGERSDKAIDSEVMRALENHDLWKGQRPMTGGGDMAVRADELSRALSLKEEKVADSLERLEAKGRVRNIGGYLADPTARWHTTRKF